jgi:hypothetical protein
LLQNGANTLQLKVSDAAGNNGPIASQPYTLDTALPALAVAGVGDGNLSAAEATGAGGVITVNTDADASISVVFSGPSGNVSKNLVGNGSAQAVTLTAGDLVSLGNGSISVATTAADAAGNSRFSALGSFNLDTLAPAAPTINAVATNDVVNAEAKTAGVSVSGTAESGSSVNVTWGATSHTVTATSGSWTASFSAGEIPADGTMTISAQTTDIAGNVSSTSSRSVSVDTLAPSTATPPTLSASSDTGVLGDGFTSDTTPTITGSTEANATITLMDDLGGGAFSVLGTTTANAEGAWSITSSALSEGTHHLIANASDAAFNVAGYPALDLTIGPDLSAPGLLSASVNGSSITLTYNEALDPTHQPASSYFLATVNGTNRGVGNIAISGNSVQLNLLAPVSQGDSVTVSYSDPSGGNDGFAVQDAVGNDATGFAAMAVTNLTTGNATSTSLVSANFSTADGSISYLFNEPMQASSPSGVTILKNGTGGNILTGAGFSADGYTLTFTTSASLSASDFVVVTYSGGGDLRDMDGNLVGQGTLVIGGGNANNINLETLSGTHGQFTVRSNGGDDTIFGSGNNDVLYGNAGSDRISGGWGQDTIRLFEGTTRASDTVVLSTDDGSGSQPYFFDSVYGFDVFGTSTNDQLDLPSNQLAASTSGFVNGADAGVIKSHSIDAGGVLSFGSSDSGTAVLINAGNLGDATAYLLQNLVTPGQTVAFGFDNDGNGQSDSLFVFQDGGGNDIDNDLLIKLIGVNGATLGTTASQNVVQLVDTTGPSPTDAGFALGANAIFSLSLSENTLVTDTTGLTLLKNGAGNNIATGVSANGNVLNIQTNATLAASDYVLLSYDGATGNVRDNNGNSMSSELPGIAIGGSGDGVIDISALSGDYGIYDPAGNNTLIGNAGENWLDGGSGNDALNGGAGNDELFGSKGADNFNGGTGEDRFRFEQGDSTTVSYNAGVYTFAGNVADVISGGFDVAGTNVNANIYNETGDRIILRSPIPGNNLGYLSTQPTDGLVSDQSYYLTRGNYSAGVFTNNATGADTLVVYDGNSAAGSTSQTALVLQGVNPPQLTPTSWGDIYLTGSSSNYSQIFGSPGVGQPTVNSVRIQNDINSHQTGETLAQYVYFDQDVLVAGAPQLQLVIGVAGNYHTVLADYDAANSGGNRLAFNYTLEAGDVGQMSIGNLYLPAGSNITNLAGSLVAFAGINNTGNNQASVWNYGAATQSGTSANDWIAPLAGTNTDTAAALTAALTGLSAGTGGERDLLAFDLKYFGGELNDVELANGLQLNADGRSLQITRDNGTVNLYELVSGTPQLVKTLYTSGDGGFERLMIRLTDSNGTLLGQDFTADLELVSGVYTDLIRNNQMNHGSMFGDTISLPADPNAFQMVWPDNGDDIVIGSNNADHSDVSDGNDTISLGAGDDHFGWWGIGSSTLDGGGGNDTLTLSGGIAPELGGDISYTLGGDGKLHVYAGITEFAVIEQGGAGDAWQYRITSMEEISGDMMVTLKDIESFQVGTQSDWLSLVMSPSLFVVADTTAPTSTGATFNNAANAVITLTYSEAVSASSPAGLSLSLNPAEANGWFGSAINLGGTPTGLGTSTVSFPTTATLGATDVVRLSYDASVGDLADLADNPVPAAEIWIGGSGDSVIDLDWYWPQNGFPVTLRGNAGNDRLVGTNFNDLLLDGSGADTLTGSIGADSIILVENGSSIAFSRDVVDIEMGESIVGAMDVVRSSATSPTTSGFDIASATTANHDALDLPSNVIAANVGNTDGIDVGGIARHSISSGIVSFMDANSNPILINSGNLQNAIGYLSANFVSPGVTAAFKADTDSNGAVDSLYVFQDNGTVPLANNFVLPDTLVKLQNLIGIDSAVLGTTAGTNVVQIQDTQAPEPVGFGLANDGLALDLTENTFATTSVALTLQKNGTTAMTVTSVEGNGTPHLVFHTNQSLAASDWVLVNYNGASTTDGIRDASNNVLLDDGEPNYGGDAWGSNSNNSIDLSAAPADKHFDLNGFGGDDTLIGSSGADWIVGGSGADTLTGGGGEDRFEFEQGDSPTVTGSNLGGDGVLNNGDTFSFANGVDRVTDLVNNEAIELSQSMSEFFGDTGGLIYMGNAPSNGLATNQGYFAQQGNYSGSTFTVNAGGADTLIVWDGDSSSAVTQTAIVLTGVQAAQLQLGGSYIQLTVSSGFTNANDTYVLPMPSVIGQTVDALGGSDTLLMSFYPNHIVPDGPGLHFGDILDPASISTTSIVYSLNNQSGTSYYLSGMHDVLAAQPVTDYDLTLQNFEHIRFDDGTDVLDIDLVTDIGWIDGSNVNGVLDGTTLAANYLFASYEVGGGVTQVIGGAQMADTVGLFFDIASDELQMNLDESGANPVWRFNEGANGVFTIAESGSNWAIDYAYNGVGTDTTLSNIEYAAVINNLVEGSVLLRLSFETGQPMIII